MFWHDDNSHQNHDAGLRVVNVVLWENLVLVVVLILESKGPSYLFPQERETFFIELIKLTGTST